ncbi:hypothetical protein [Nocardiopsis coralliicola]
MSPDESADAPRSSAATPAGPGARPLNAVIGAVLQGLIGAVIAVEGVRILATALSGGGAGQSFALPLAALALGAAAAVLYVAWGLFMLRGWARGPIVLTQIFMLIIAYSMYTSDQMGISVAMVAAAVASLGLVLSSSVTAALFPGGRLPTEHEAPGRD